MKSSLIAGLLLPAALITSSVGAEGTADWRKVDEAHIYNGEEMMSPKFIDLNSALLAKDGYIVFRQILATPTYEMRNGEVFVNNDKRRFDKSWYFNAIHCQKQVFFINSSMARF